MLYTTGIGAELRTLYSDSDVLREEIPDKMAEQLDELMEAGPLTKQPSQSERRQPIASRSLGELSLFLRCRGDEGDERVSRALSHGRAATRMGTAS
jgi:hypothetical protein